MRRIKVVAAIGTRPGLTKLSCVSAEFEDPMPSLSSRVVWHEQDR